MNRILVTVIMTCSQCKMIFMWGRKSVLVSYFSITLKRFITPYVLVQKGYQMHVLRNLLLNLLSLKLIGLCTGWILKQILIIWKYL